MPTHCKKGCSYCPPPHHHHPNPDAPRDWQMHPSWITGMEALNAYGNWVSSFVLPVAFQWIEEHKPEVYASIPEHLKDDVGVVIAAAFRLVKELPSYKDGCEKCKHTEIDPANLNPVWTGLARKIRAGTQEAFAEQARLLGDEEK